MKVLLRFCILHLATMQISSFKLLNYALLRPLGTRTFTVFYFKACTMLTLASLRTLRLKHELSFHFNDSLFACLRWFLMILNKVNTFNLTRSFLESSLRFFLLFTFVFTWRLLPDITSFMHVLHLLDF